MFAFSICNEHIGESFPKQMLVFQAYTRSMLPRCFDYSYQKAITTLLVNFYLPFSVEYIKTRLVSLLLLCFFYFSPLFFYSRGLTHFTCYSPLNGAKQCLWRRGEFHKTCTTVYMFICCIASKAKCCVLSSSYYFLYLFSFLNIYSILYG